MPAISPVSRGGNRFSPTSVARDDVGLQRVLRRDQRPHRRGGDLRRAARPAARSRPAPASCSRSSPAARRRAARRARPCRCRAVTASSVAMPLAQNPSIAPFSSASRRGQAEIDRAAGGARHRADADAFAVRVEPGGGEQRPQPHLDPGRGADPLAPQRREVAAGDAEIGPHDQEPVHALRQRAEQLDAAPFGKGRQRAVRRAADEIDRAVAQRLVGAVDREDQLGRDVEPLLREKPELGRRHRRKIRIRDQVRYRELHASAFHQRFHREEPEGDEEQSTHLRPLSRRAWLA